MLISFLEFITYTCHLSKISLSWISVKYLQTEHRQKSENGNLEGAIKEKLIWSKYPFPVINTVKLPWLQNSVKDIKQNKRLSGNTIWKNTYCLTTAKISDGSGRSWRCLSNGRNSWAPIILFSWWTKSLLPTHTSFDLYVIHDKKTSAAVL